MLTEKEIKARLDGIMFEVQAIRDGFCDYDATIDAGRHHEDLMTIGDLNEEQDTLEMKLNCLQRYN